MESVGGRGEIAISSKETVTSEQSSNVFTHSPNCSFTHSYLHLGLHSFSHKFNHSFPHSLLPLFTKSLSHELPHAAVSQALNACHFHPQTCLTPSLLDLCIDRSQSLKCYFHASLPTAPGLMSPLPGGIPALHSRSRAPVQGFCTPVSLSSFQQSLSPSIFKTTSSLNLGIVSYPFPWQHTWRRIGTQLRLEKSICCQEQSGQRILDQQGTHSQEGEECPCAGTRGHQP